MEIKKWITWDRFCLTHDYNVDPTHGVVLGQWPITFEETGYGNTEDDKRFIGIISYDDSVVDESLLNKFISKYSYHSFTIKTDEEISALLLKWYGDEVVLEDGVIVDNRPIDI
jgi:hypothetical protein